MPNISIAEKAQRRKEILAVMPAEQSTIAEATGLSVATISRWIARLHDAGAIRVGSWRRNHNGGDPIPTYVVGKGEDAPCLVAPLSNAERHRRMRQRKREAVSMATDVWVDVWSRLTPGGKKDSDARITSDQPNMMAEQLCLETF